ncbi:hypothetical protein NQ176_g8320 [Zarea fungicola]|uniref:Uncharacterized protein n=1 Tax=Zarea fungicola TaxID=93591 RepID=A0ACC1MVE5_9HYPO|nr:hypothetical protein NQ176_g8320 [Lecanicillium fungicola]
MMYTKVISALSALLAVSNAYDICDCDAGDGGVSQNGFSQILNGLNQNSNDQFCINSPLYEGCYTKKESQNIAGNFYGCGIFCADANDSGACVYLCARDKRFFEYSSSPLFHPTTLDVVSVAIGKGPADFDTAAACVAECDNSSFALWTTPPSTSLDISCSEHSAIELTLRHLRFAKLAFFMEDLLPLLITFIVQA